MAGVQAAGVAAADDHALRIHHVDVVRQDGHGAVDDMLRHGGVEFEHEKRPRE